MGEKRVIDLEVRGMSCGHCVAAVRKALEAVEGVFAAEVTLDPPRARVTIDDGLVGPDALTAATADEGYPSSVAR